MANKAPKEKTLERRIYFYRAFIGRDENGDPKKLDPIPMLKHIDQLSFPSGEAYLNDHEEHSTCCWIDDLKNPQQMRVGLIRRHALPQIENKGVLSPLNIPLTSGLAEQSHVVFFPDNIVGADFNFYGPRIGRLATYLCAKAGEHCEGIRFQLLLRKDMGERLAKLKDVRLFQLRVEPSYLETLKSADDDIYAAFAAANRLSNAEEIEVLLKPRPRSRSPLLGKLLSITKMLGMRKNLNESIAKFTVKGLNEETHRVEKLDVLNHLLLSKKRIIRADNRTRALNRDSAYQAIREAYVELKAEIAVARGVDE